MKISIGLSGKVYDETENTSLQDAFSKFREAKIRERKLMKSYKSNLNSPRDDKFKNDLRLKFIEQCRKYFGVPYHVKYKPPDEEPAPLYLDCCGLVRQVVKDLADDFGFLIGKWNQAYQFDMLPKSISFEELKPGDLIFYEGTYNSNRSKPQKHNMVHVEVFIGGESGESTIGARFFKGVVQEFSSYKFKSTTWDLVRYHFKSLDPWLEGKHESCCPDHNWHSEALALAAAAGKRSIFNDCQDENESAGGMDEDEDEDDIEIEDEEASKHKGTCEIIEDQQKDIDSSNSMLCVPCSPRDVLIRNQAIEIEFLKRELDKAKEEILYSKDQKNKSNNEEPSEPPCEPNNSSSSSNLNIKNGLSRSVESLKSTPLLKSSETPPRNNNITPMRGPRVRVAKSMELKKSIPLTYYLCKANGWKLWKEALDKRGWQQLPFDYKFTTSFGFKYVEGRNQIDFKAHVPGQLVCHIPNNNVITTKTELLQTFRDAHKNYKETPIKWIPETYLLNSPLDCSALIELQETNDKSESPVQIIWIYKPSSSNRGRGLKVIEGMQNLKEIVMAEDSPGHPPKLRGGIIQRYLTNPLLIDGYKFDIRCYMLIARNFPSYVVFYHPGYCRMTLKPFTLTPQSLEDSSIHLTNAAVQKHTPEYQDRKEFQIQTPEAVASAIEKGGNLEGAKYIRENMDHDIKCCMVDLLKAAIPKLARKHGYFDLYGLDFMIHDNNKLVLLEVNTNPALSLDNSTLANMLPAVVENTVDLVLRLQGPERLDVASALIDQSIDDQVLSSIPGNFQLIFNEKSKFRYS